MLDKSAFVGNRILTL